MSDRLDSLRERYGRLGWPLGLAGAVLLAAGTFLSWSYVATILGNLSVYVYPGSVQLFALFLALVAIAFLLMYRGPLHRLGDWFKSALAVRTLGLGSAVFMTIVLLLIAVQSGGLINIDPGGWVSWVGSLLLAVGGQLMQVRAIKDPIYAKTPGLGRDHRHRHPARRWPCSARRSPWARRTAASSCSSSSPSAPRSGRWPRAGSSPGSGSSPPGTAGSSCSARSSSRSSSRSPRAAPTRTCRSRPRSSSSRPPRWA